MFSPRSCSNIPGSIHHAQYDEMPVLGRRPHEGRGEGEDDDGGPENDCAGVYVGEEAEDDSGDGEDGGEGGTGEGLVLYPEAGVVPVTLRLGLTTVVKFHVVRFSCQNNLYMIW